MNHTVEVIIVFLGTGFGSSLLTEAVSWLNMKLTGTPMNGLGAYLLSGAVAFCLGSLQVLSSGIPSVSSLHDIAEVTGAVWIASQLFFHLIIKNVDSLHVTPATDTSAPIA
jgi:hypothetical protein